MATRRPDGRLQKKFSVNGKKYIVCAKTAKELAEKEFLKRKEIELGIERMENPTVSEYYDRWVKGRKVSEATLRTQDKIFNIVKNVPIIDEANIKFGDLKMRNVKKNHLIILQETIKMGVKQADGTYKERKTQTTNDYMNFVKHLFSDAFKDETIERNPAKLIENYQKVEEEARDSIHRALSKEETAAFFECQRCKDSFYRNAFLFAIGTGMRAGEIGSLKYSDIKDGYIHVERTVTRLESGAFAIGRNAKTKAGKRTIPMNDNLKRIIANQKEYNRMLDDRKIVPMDDLIFKSPEGGLLLATPLDREIKRICKACGIEDFTMHGFRSTFATRCIEGGMNPKTLQELLGHTNFNLTMSLYGHCMENTKKEEMGKIDLGVAL